MPELPEVETIARALREGGRDGPPVLGAVVEQAHLLWPRTLAEPAPELFKVRILGQAIQAVGRRGKFLVLTLSQDSLLIHLRMSGDLFVELTAGPEEQALFQKHDRLVLNLSGSGAKKIRLTFRDPRKFGRVWLTRDPEQILGGLGPEPLDPQFTAFDLYRRLHSADRQIKPLLLDQTFLAGLGNIYTDEALFQARIHPLRRSASLSLEEASWLWTAIRTVLGEGIRRNGASIDWIYQGGDFQNIFQVYQRTGQNCPQCGTPITKIFVGQRGTHYCPVCQPEQ